MPHSQSNGHKLIFYSLIGLSSNFARDALDIETRVWSYLRGTTKEKENMTKAKKLYKHESPFDQTKR